jgi:hypothetical protein
MNGSDAFQTNLSSRSGRQPASPPNLTNGWVIRCHKQSDHLSLTRFLTSMIDKAFTVLANLNVLFWKTGEMADGVGGSCQ